MSSETFTAVPVPPAALPKVPGSWALSVRAFRCWLLTYRRTWRSTVWSSVLGPLFYLGAMGYGLGSLVDKNGTAALGGVPYVVFVAPAVLCVQAMNTGLGNSLYPVFGAMRWNALYLAARATHAPPRGHLPGPPDVHRDADRDELRLLHRLHGGARADQVARGRCCCCPPRC